MVVAVKTVQDIFPNTKPKPRTLCTVKELSMLIMKLTVNANYLCNGKRNIYFMSYNGTSVIDPIHCL
jgi:hypothetical protein